MFSAIHALVSLVTFVPWVAPVPTLTQPIEVIDDMIKFGMTEQDVVPLIGRHADCSSDSVLSMWDVWKFGNATNTITYSSGQFFLVYALHSAANDQLKTIPPVPFSFGLDLAFSQVTDVGLQELGKLANLTKLALSYTQVSDTGLKEIANITNLVELDLDHSKVTDSGLTELVRLTNLSSLCLNGTTVTDAGLKEISHLPHLSHLYIEDTEVTDAGLQDLAKLPNLSVLMLTHTRVTAAGMTEIAKIQSLKELWIDDTLVTDTSMMEFTKLTNLTTLVLNNMPGITDHGTDFISGRGECLIDPGDTERTDTSRRLESALPHCSVICCYSVGEIWYIHDRQAKQSSDK
jgi:hypothetical protein